MRVNFNLEKQDVVLSYSGESSWIDQVTLSYKSKKKVFVEVATGHMRYRSIVRVKDIQHFLDTVHDSVGQAIIHAFWNAKSKSVNS